MPSGYVGRFAPSPTGPLHAGSLLAATASYLQARSVGGRWLLRIEDIDPPREVPGAADLIVRSLAAHGFQWDDPVVYQSSRLEHFRARIALIQDHTFWCRCSRRDIRQAQKRANTPHYPGTCRTLDHKDGSLRFRLDHHAAFDDLFQGPIPAQPAMDDFVIWRRDDLPAYQWAVSVDDADQGITEVVRGADLLATTPRQIALMQALGAPVPQFAHVPEIVNDQGQKLSKQTQAPALDDQNPAPALCAAFSILGLSPEPAMASADLPDLWAWAIRTWPSTPLTLKRKFTAT